MSHHRADPASLELAPDAMRALGHQVVDLVVDHLSGLRDQPAIRRGTRAALEERLREPLPAAGEDPAEVVAQAVREVFSAMGHVQHPRFFAFVPGPSNFMGVLAELLGAGFNPFCGTWMAGSGPIQLELVTVDWLRQLCGLPEGAGGLFVSGGSLANLNALAAARHARLGGHDRHARAVLYTSDQTHSAVPRALRVLGFGDHQLRLLPSDEGYRLPLAPLSEAIRADRDAGREPFCVVANAGTTSTGAVDPLPELAALCRRQGLWLHADAAYGGGAVLCDRGAELLAGLGEVDSLALDPHKWLFQPFESGCVLLRDGGQLRDAFHILPEVLRDTDRGSEQTNLCDYGVQLSRSFRALKLWMTFKTFGSEAIGAAVARGFERAEQAEALLRAAGCWQIVTPAQLAIVSFRYAPPGVDQAALDRVHERLIDRVVEDGFMALSSTRLRGRTVLRLCPINPRTTEHDLAASIERLASLAAGLLS